MAPVYSRDECIAAIRDYYGFLAQMYMDPSFIIEPPQDGWPHITQERMKDLGKSNEVVELLRHLPYIECKPYSSLPEGLPGGSFIDWTYIAQGFQTGMKHPENQLIMSEGYDDQFEAKIPACCIGLVHGGIIMDNEESDVILLDTKFGVVYWMNCPAEIQESASPQPCYLSHEDEDEEEDSEEDEDSDNDEDEINWGPCWPVQEFFEMLKNQFRQLHFVPRNKFNIVDVWTKAAKYRIPMPEGFIHLLQSIYHKHDWPDLNKYHKEDCMFELQREVEEKFPDHYRYEYPDMA